MINPILEKVIVQEVRITLEDEYDYISNGISQTNLRDVTIEKCEFSGITDKDIIDYMIKSVESQISFYVEIGEHI